MINTITVCGNMGADPEEHKGERRTYAKGRIGVFQPGKDREGNPKPTIWFGLTGIEKHDRRDRPARGEAQQPAADDLSDLPF